MDKNYIYHIVLKVEISNLRKMRRQTRYDVMLEQLLTRNTQYAWYCAKSDKTERQENRETF